MNMSIETFIFDPLTNIITSRWSSSNFEANATRISWMYSTVRLVMWSLYEVYMKSICLVWHLILNMLTSWTILFYHLRFMISGEVSEETNILLLLLHTHTHYKSEDKNHNIPPTHSTLSQCTPRQKKQTAFNNYNKQKVTLAHIK